MVKKKPTKKLTTTYFPQKINEGNKIQKFPMRRKKHKGFVRRYWVEGNGNRNGFWVEGYTKKKKYK